MASKMGKAPSQRGTGFLSVPVRIARHIPDGAYFEAELTDEGILYRFVGMTPTVREEKPPSVAWLNGEGE